MLGKPRDELQSCTSSAFSMSDISRKSSSVDPAVVGLAVGTAVIFAGGFAFGIMRARSRTPVVESQMTAAASQQLARLKPVAPPTAPVEEVSQLPVRSAWYGYSLMALIGITGRIGATDQIRLPGSWCGNCTQLHCVCGRRCLRAAYARCRDGKVVQSDST